MSENIAPVGARSASDIVRTFLQTMEARDLAAAKTFLADGFTMTFPGDSRFSSLEQLVDWSKERYRAVHKDYEKFDEAVGADGVCVYCFGTLSGTWLDGSEFRNIRFIDRFTVQGGKLTDQRVWNDMAEHLRQNNP